MSVYLLHLKPAYKHAKHYLGFAEDVEKRVEIHKKGQGANLTKVAVSSGSELILTRVWEGADRTFERKLKNSKNVPKLCPLCIT